MTRDESDDVEEMLGIWFRWARAYRENLGAGRASASCRGYVIGGEGEAEGDYGEDDAVRDARIAANQAVEVEACLHDLTGLHRGVIGIVQANKHGPSVYKYPRLTTEQQHVVYQEAKTLLLPMLRKRGLVQPSQKSA